MWQIDYMVCTESLLWLAKYLTSLYLATNLDIAIKLTMAGVRTILIYGCESIHLDKSQVKELDQTQYGTLLKLSWDSQNTPIPLK